MKNEAVIHALEMGYRVVSTDTDIVWLRNPLSYLRTAVGSEYDIVFQCDSALSTSTCHLCAGFFYANATSNAIETFQWLVSTKLKVQAYSIFKQSSIVFISIVLVRNSRANIHRLLKSLTQIVALNWCFVAESNHA